MYLYTFILRVLRYLYTACTSVFVYCVYFYTTCTCVLCVLYEPIYFYTACTCVLCIPLNLYTAFTCLLHVLVYCMYLCTTCTCALRVLVYLCTACTCVLCVLVYCVYCVSHLASVVPAVAVQSQLIVVCLCVVCLCVVRVCVVRVRQGQGGVRHQRRFGGQRVLPAQLLGGVGVQGAQQRRRRRRHGDGQVGGGQGEALGGRVAQVDRLLVLGRRRRRGGRAEVQRGGAAVAVDNLGFPDDGAVHHSGGGRSQSGKAVPAAAL